VASARTDATAQAETLGRLSHDSGICKGEWPWAQLCAIQRQLVVLQEKSKVSATVRL
jgi:hypothetical protein